MSVLLTGALQLFGTALLSAWLVIFLAALWAVMSSICRKAALDIPFAYRFFDRNRTAAIAVLRAFDILGCTFWLAPLYVLGLADRPSGRQMISSYIGKAQINGHHWAGWVADVIDLVMGERHCERAYRHYLGLDG